jgi:hypothetical protein
MDSLSSEQQYIPSYGLQNAPRLLKQGISESEAEKRCFDLELCPLKEIVCRSCGPIAQDLPFLLQDVQKIGGETSLAKRGKACNHVQSYEEHRSYPIVPNECIYTLGRPHFAPSLL